MPDLITPAVGRIRLLGMDSKMLDYVCGGYQHVFDLKPSSVREPVPWVIRYEKVQANPILYGPKITVEHEIQAVHVDTSSGFELHFPEDGVIVRRSPAHITVAGYGELTLELLRKALRQVITRTEQSKGMVQIHAAAASDSEGRVIAFVGPKGSGKTTSLTAALVIRGLQLVSNDRLCLIEDGRSNNAYGWPTAFTVGHGTLKAAGLWKNVPPDRRRTDEKMRFWPDEFARLCRVELRRLGVLRLVAFTNLDFEFEESVLVQLDPRTAIEDLLANHIFFDEEDDEHPDWLQLGGALTKSEAKMHLESMLSSAPIGFFKVTFGKDIAALAASVAKLEEVAARLSTLPIGAESPPSFTNDRPQRG